MVIGQYPVEPVCDSVALLHPGGVAAYEHAELETSLTGADLATGPSDSIPSEREAGLPS